MLKTQTFQRLKRIQKSYVYKLRSTMLVTSFGRTVIMIVATDNGQTKFPSFAFLYSFVEVSSSRFETACAILLHLLFFFSLSLAILRSKTHAHTTNVDDYPLAVIIFMRRNFSPKTHNSWDNESFSMSR